MKRMVLFTDGFPYDPWEKPFIYNELCELAKRFEVTIVAYTKKRFADSDIEIELPKNVVAKKYIIDDVGRKEVLRMFLQTTRCAAYRNEKTFLAQEKNCKPMKKEALWYITRAKLFGDWIQDNIDIDNTDVFYTYWNSYATLALSMLKEKMPNIKLVTRMHGYDLYDERTNFGRQYFKSYIDEKVNKICFISEHGCDFYKHRYGAGDDDKYVVCNIGVKAAGSIPVKTSKDISDNVYTIASCSSVIPLKRVELIVEALGRIDEVNIRWAHIGTGSEYDKIKKLCQDRLDSKTNIVYELKGLMDNNQVREFYDKEYMDFFITTSSTEGSPVSIQEALAYGMVVIGTDVGEVAKLVEGNGCLMKSNPTVEEIAHTIEKLCNTEQSELLTLRKNALTKWQEQYNALENANRFISILETL